MVGGSDFTLLTCSSSSNSSSSTGDSLDYLPDDILMQILARIPAQDIVESTMFVCRKWNEMIRTRNFAYAHLHHSPPGLLVQNYDRQNTTKFMSLIFNQVQISEYFNRRGDKQHFLSSCNGLTLEPKTNINKGDHHQLVITNHVTGQHFDLPPFILDPRERPRSAIAYAATRMEYKVVRTYYQSGRLHCAILTVGVDNSWRLVDTQHLSLEASRHLTMCPLVSEGFVHWAQGIRSDHNHILSLNLETEVITQTPMILRSNIGGRRRYICYKYLPGVAGSLSLLITNRLKCEVWEMKPQTGEWKKLSDIDLEPHKALLNAAVHKDATHCEEYCHLIPSGWLKFGELIVFVATIKHLFFGQSTLDVAYNLQTKDIVSCYKSDHALYSHLAHTNSLVWIC